MTISLSRTSVISRLQNPAINIRPWPSSYLTYLGYLSVDYSHSLFLEILSSFGFLENTSGSSLFLVMPLPIFSDLITLHVGASRIQLSVCPFSSTSILLVQFSWLLSPKCTSWAWVSPQTPAYLGILPACLISTSNLTHPSKLLISPTVFHISENNTKYPTPVAKAKIYGVILESFLHTPHVGHSEWGSYHNHSWPMYH